MIIKNVRGEVLYEDTAIGRHWQYYVFSHMNLAEADFSGLDCTYCMFHHTDLTGAKFNNSVLNYAEFQWANLDGADFRGASLYKIRLSGASIRNTLFDLDTPFVPDLHTQIRIGDVNMGAWHCGTTHCHAGWAIHLAGDAGERLAGQVGNDAAGALIIDRSCPYLDGQVPDFYVNQTEGIDRIRLYKDVERRIREAHAGDRNGDA